MFENVGKEIKNDLSGEIFLSTVASICVSVVLVLIALFIAGTYGSTDTLNAVLIMSPIIVILVGIISYFKAKKKVMYFFAFGELVETVSKIYDKQIADSSTPAVITNSNDSWLWPSCNDSWLCPSCNEKNRLANKFCYHCGQQQPESPTESATEQCVEL